MTKLPAEIYQDYAEYLIKRYGVVEARRVCIADRDMNTMGTASYAFHNAVLKVMERMGREDKS
jgi:hypothetical protein